MPQSLPEFDLPRTSNGRSVWIFLIYAYFRGKIVPYAEAKVGVLTHGLNYGTAAFGGMRAYWNAQKGTALSLSGHMIISGGFSILPVDVDGVRPYPRSLDPDHH